MNFDFNRLLEDRNAMFRAAIYLVLAVIYITPGLILITYYDHSLLVSLSEAKLFVYSAAISLPFHILAIALLISPPSTQVEIFQDPSKIRGIVLSVGALLWSVVWVFLVHWFAIFGSWILPGFESLSEPYRIVLSYFMCLAYLMVFGIWGFYKVTIPYLKRWEANK